MGSRALDGPARDSIRNVCDQPARLLDVAPQGHRRPRHALLHTETVPADSGNVLTIDKRSIERRQISATIFGINGGPVMLGDDISRMADERLRMVKQLFPRLPEAAMPWTCLRLPPGLPKGVRLKAEAMGRLDLVAVFNYQTKHWRRRSSSRAGPARQPAVSGVGLLERTLLGVHTGSMDLNVPPQSCACCGSRGAVDTRGWHQPICTFAKGKPKSRRAGGTRQRWNSRGSPAPRPTPWQRVRPRSERTRTQNPAGLWIGKMQRQLARSPRCHGLPARRNRQADAIVCERARSVKACLFEQPFQLIEIAAHDGDQFLFWMENSRLPESAPPRSGTPCATEEAGEFAAFNIWKNRRKFTMPWPSPHHPGTTRPGHSASSGSPSPRRADVRH